MGRRRSLAPASRPAAGHRRSIVVGADVIVEWVDSGAGDSDLPGRGKVRLQVGRTHGRVTFVGRDEKLHERVCTPRRCRCAYVELAMCSSGADDDRSDLAAIWLDAIVSVRAVRAGPA